MWRTYWQLYRWRVLGHLAWTGLEIADRFDMIEGGLLERANARRSS
jgi:hypothetical protein